MEWDWAATGVIVAGGLAFVVRILVLLDQRSSMKRLSVLVSIREQLEGIPEAKKNLDAAIVDLTNRTRLREVPRDPAKTTALWGYVVSAVLFPLGLAAGWLFDEVDASGVGDAVQRIVFLFASLALCVASFTVLLSTWRAK